MDEIGEQFVVSTALLRVAAGLHLQEALGLVILGFTGLLVEILLSKGSLALKLRPGASPGIFLGSIAWPLVVASRLQYSVENLDGGQGRVLFWTAILCSLRLLVFLSGFSKEFRVFDRLERSALGLRTMTAVFTTFMVLAYVTGSSRFFFELAQVVVQVFCSRFFLLEILRRFPGSATPGEASVVASGLALYGGTVISALWDKLLDYSMKREMSVDSVLQVALLGMSLIPLAYKTFMRLTGDRKGASFVGAVSLILVFFVPAWLNVVVGLQSHPVVWLSNFMLEKPVLRFGLCVYWLAVLCVLPYLYKVARDGRIPHILVRKCYHVLAVIMFVPALLIQPEFLHLAFTAAFAVFVLVEMLRIWRVPPLAARVQEFMSVFADQRDTDGLIISHFSLLLGCALPVWLHSKTEARPLAPFAGILSIGIGDTLASYAGYTYGSWRLGRKTRKTVEGTSAGIISLIVSCMVLQFFLPSSSCTRTTEVTTAAVLAGLVEAYTSQLDNMFVPLIFYSLLCV